MIDSNIVYMNQKRINIEYEIMLKLIRRKTHGRELSKELRMPLTTIQRALKQMIDANLIEFEVSGKNKIFTIKKNILAKKFVYNAENYKLMKLIDKYPFFEPLISDILKESKNNIMLLFGSYARFDAVKQSDIDLYVETKSKDVKKKLEMINSKLNVKIGLFDLDSLLVKETIKNHVILGGVEEFYEKIRFFE